MKDKINNVDLINENKKLMDRIIRDLKDTKILNYVSSVIISGSFGRDEPTYDITESGELHYKSDIEMVLVYNSWRDLALIRQNKYKVINRYNWIELELMPISRDRLLKKRNHNYSLFSPRKKTLFTFDFYNGSKTIWGKDFIDGNVDLQSVDLFEGKRIVANRIAELLYLSKSSNIEDSELIRWKAKIILAIGTAVLLNEGIYDSSYKKQYEAMINNRKLICDFFDYNFLEIYIWAYKYLRCGLLNSIPCSDDEIRKYVKKIYNYYKRKRINKSNTGCMYIFIREAFLLLKYDKSLAMYFYNPKNLIFDNVMKHFIENSDEAYRWAEAWKKVLN